MAARICNIPVVLEISWQTNDIAAAGSVFSPLELDRNSRRLTDRLHVTSLQREGFKDGLRKHHGYYAPLRTWESVR